MLEKRYDLKHRSEDLDESIHMAQQALDKSKSQGPSARASCQVNLSSKLLRRHRKTSDAEDLERALQYCYEASNLVPKHPAIFAVLDIAVYSKYRESQDLDELKTSIRQLNRLSTQPETERLSYQAALTTWATGSMGDSQGCQTLETSDVPSPKSNWL